jgi:hypothetical protein
MNMNRTPGSLRLPLQAAPVDRTSSAAALSGSGVGASQDWGAIAGQAVQQLLPVALGALSSFL